MSPFCFFAVNPFWSSHLLLFLSSFSSRRTMVPASSVRAYARLERRAYKKQQQQSTRGGERYVSLLFCFFAVCFLVFSFTAVLVLLLLEQDEQDDGPSVQRRTRPAADEAHGGRGPRQMRPAAAGAKGCLPFAFLQFAFWSSHLLLFLFSFSSSRTMVLASHGGRDPPHAGRGPRETRATGDEAHGGRGQGKRSPRRTRPQQTRLQQTWGLRPSKQAQRRRTRRDAGRKTTR